MDLGLALNERKERMKEYTRMAMKDLLFQLAAEFQKPAVVQKGRPQFRLVWTMMTDCSLPVDETEEELQKVVIYRQQIPDTFWSTDSDGKLFISITRFRVP